MEFCSFFFSIQFLLRDIYSRKIFNQILNRMQGINDFNAFFSWWCFFIQKAFLRNSYALIWNIQTFNLAFNRFQSFLLHCCALSLKFNWMKFTWVFSNWTLSCNNSEIVSESAIIELKLSIYKSSEHWINCVHLARIWCHSHCTAPISINSYVNL